MVPCNGAVDVRCLEVLLGDFVSAAGSACILPVAAGRLSFKGSLARFETVSVQVSFVVDPEDFKDMNIMRSLRKQEVPGFHCN